MKITCTKREKRECMRAFEEYCPFDVKDISRDQRCCKFTCDECLEKYIEWKVKE